MSVKILGGCLKGMSLTVPSEDGLRPTSVRLRRKIFDANQNLDGITFVDLCAGSGLIGLEAWSRGASRVFLIDKSIRAARHLYKIRDEIFSRQQSEVKKRPLEVIRNDAMGFLSRYDHLNLKSEKTILYFDPPFLQGKLYESFINWLLAVKFSGVVWLEADERKAKIGENSIKRHLNSLILNSWKAYSTGEHSIFSFEIASDHK